MHPISFYELESKADLLVLVHWVQDDVIFYFIKKTAAWDGELLNLFGSAFLTCMTCASGGGGGGCWSNCCCCCWSFPIICNSWLMFGAAAGWTAAAACWAARMTAAFCTAWAARVLCCACSLYIQAVS